ncbi:amidohydrolase family protein [Phytoactinopolyspora halotolerans]|uniref:Amidohydrolase family protein n=1 Tax=Phytoactinopolyspora halotolerans TaxID=1981512 RepID=A0A6L9SGY1_9ACTN|nr:amidohydrolase family protein [Phytoactinopolyspora halotolerans]NEE04459.1 amidohydrolase family protein [Phytoactinopolyspora halotolerans]
MTSADIRTTHTSTPNRPRTATILGRSDDAPGTAGIVLRALRGVRAPDGSVVDVYLDRDRISAVTAASAPPPADGAAAGGTHVHEGPRPLGAEIDAHGWRILPAAAEPHAHLDKALSAPRVDLRQNDLESAISQWRELYASIDRADIYQRASDAVRRYVTHGITTIRTHVDVPAAGDAMRGVDALTRLRDELRGRVTLQVVALVASDTPTPVVEEAIERGVDLLGGCPHLAPDPRVETARLADLAERHGLDVDLHTDEQVSLGEGAHDVDIAELAEQVLARGFAHRVVASHCVRLGSLPPERLAAVLELVRRAGLGIVTLPITNLYLQGRDAPQPAPRGLPALRAILDLGIPLAAGGDNLRDPFNPVGRADPFETTSLLVTAGHLTPAEALAAVTTGARTVLGLPPVGIDAGCAADLILVPDTDLGDVLAGQVDARVVVHAGRIVADSRMARSIDLTGTAPNTAEPTVIDSTGPTVGTVPMYSESGGERHVR